MTNFRNITLIDHEHRLALGLTLEDYCVIKEIAQIRSSNMADCAAKVGSKLSLTIERVIIIITRLKAFNLVQENENGFIIHARYFETMHKSNE